MELVKAFILPANVPLTLKQGETFIQRIQITDAANTRTFRVVGVDEATKVFTIRGDATDWLRVGDVVDVERLSDEANRYYTITAAAMDTAGLDTLVTVSETVPLTNRKTGIIKRRFNSPIDLTGYTITSDCKQSLNATEALFSFAVGTTDAAEGTIELSKTDDETAALESGRSYYDIKFVNVSGETAYWISGPVSVEKRITV
jgi:hypothetical protein